MSKYTLNGTVFSAQAVATGTPVLTTIMKMADSGYDGYGSLQLIDQVSVSTTGVLKVEILTSNDGTNFGIPQDNTGTALDNVVVAAHADGTALYEFPPVPIANYYRYKLTATTNNITSVTGVQSAK